METRSLRAVIWVRAIVGFITCGAMAVILLAALLEASGTAGLARLEVLAPATGLAIVLGCVGVPSLAVAYGLSRGRRWAPSFALGHDALVVSVLTVNVARLSGDLLARGGGAGAALGPGAGGMVALLCAAEASQLLRHVYGWRPAWMAFSLFALCLVVMGGVISEAGQVRAVRRVQPLLDYMGKHWVAAPQGARISVDGWPEAGGYQDRISFQVGGVDWLLMVHRGRDGRWRLPAGDFSMTDGLSGMQRVSGPRSAPHTGTPALGARQRGRHTYGWHNEAVSRSCRGVSRLAERGP